jgi:hypothetical protein
MPLEVMTIWLIHEARGRLSCLFGFENKNLSGYIAYVITE